MSISLSCPRCDAVIAADDEGELVARMQAHAASSHDLSHPLSRERILGHLREQEAEQE